MREPTAAQDAEAGRTPSPEKRPYVADPMVAAAFPHLALSCWCWCCDTEATSALPDGDIRRLQRRMNLCPDCGNKRCPRSTFHERDCTGSNDPGQPGSRYPGGTCRYCGHPLTTHNGPYCMAAPTPEKGSSQVSAPASPRSPEPPGAAP